MGVEITSAVINMIESAVWEINTETKKAQVQDKAMTISGSAVTMDKDGIRPTVIDAKKVASVLSAKETDLDSIRDYGIGCDPGKAGSMGVIGEPGIKEGPNGIS